MKVYVVSGYGYDGFEQDEEQYAYVYADREEAERKVHEMAEEQLQFVSSKDGLVYYEYYNFKNGSLRYYRLEQVCDLRIPLHKEAYVWLSKLSHICNVDEFTPKINNPADAIQIVTVAYVSIDEQEINVQ